MFRLATLGVEAAKQHRLGVQSDFFPKISSTFANLHFNKFMGDTLLVKRPVLGDITFAVPLVSKDETLVAVTVTQPITPLFKLHQVLRIARADERVARAKAGEPASEVASNVEQSFFDLLVAQRQREIAEAKLKKVENKRLLASTSTPPAGLVEHEMEWIEADKAFVLASSQVKEATVALNALLGWPADTELEPVMPAPFSENISASEAAEKALQNNPEVVEAEQTLVKAQAVSKLSKLDYVPDVAVIGGYAYQNAVPLLPNDFSYVGVMASYNLFDFGKRERTMKERNAQAAMAETGLQLVKAKVAASVAKAYFDLDRSRQLTQLARRMNSASQAIEVNYEPEEAKAARARIEAEVLQAELEYRQAFSRLQQLIGTGGK
ncbi:MAG: TolC family protein [Acidobacteriia bacterium]|nr:TolC family protein [Terriglobia bacterium]